MFSCWIYDLRVTMAVRLDSVIEAYASLKLLILSVFVSDHPDCYADPRQDVPLYQRG
jgi:hypothetical protein